MATSTPRYLRSQDLLGKENTIEHNDEPFNPMRMSFAPGSYDSERTTGSHLCAMEKIMVV